MRVVLLGVLLLGFAATALAQGKSSDDALEAAMVNWRAATWYLRIGDSNLGAIETESLANAWETVQKAGVPSSHAKDPRWRETAAEIGRLADAAQHQVEDNDVASAVRNLAQIGDDLAASRKRAGVSGFADAMRRYGGAVEEMHKLLPFEVQRRGGAFGPDLRVQVQRAADASAAAVNALPGLVPQRWANDDKLKSLLAQNADSVKAVRDALARQASGQEVAGLISVVHANYNLMFLNYGA
jgi:hypothetical protein